MEPLPSTPEYLDDKAIEQLTGGLINKYRMRRHRMEGTGPVFFKPAGTQKPIYKRADVIAWLERQPLQSTSQHKKTDAQKAHLRSLHAR